MSKENFERHAMVEVPTCPEVKTIKIVGYTLIAIAILAIVLLAQLPPMALALMSPYVVWCCVIVGAIYWVMAMRAWAIQRKK